MQYKTDFIDNHIINIVLIGEEVDKRKFLDAFNKNLIKKFSNNDQSKFIYGFSMKIIFYKYCYFKILDISNQLRYSQIKERMINNNYVVVFIDQSAEQVEEVKLAISNDDIIFINYSADTMTPLECLAQIQNIFINVEEIHALRM